jgi:hypothetical protein
MMQKTLTLSLDEVRRSYLNQLPMIAAIFMASDLSSDTKTAARLAADLATAVIDELEESGVIFT